MVNWSAAHYQNGFEEGYELGYKEGYKEGYEGEYKQGMQKQLKAIIQRMIHAGFTLDMIAIATGKNIDEIQPLLQQCPDKRKR